MECRWDCSKASGRSPFLPKAIEWPRSRSIWESSCRLGYLWHLRRDRADATEVDFNFVDRGTGTTRVEIDPRGWERRGATGPDWRNANRSGGPACSPFTLLPAPAGSDLAVPPRTALSRPRSIATPASRAVPPSHPTPSAGGSRRLPDRARLARLRAKCYTGFLAIVDERSANHTARHRYSVAADAEPPDRHGDVPTDGLAQSVSLVNPWSDSRRTHVDSRTTST